MSLCPLKSYKGGRNKGRMWILWCPFDGIFITYFGHEIVNPGKLPMKEGCVSATVSLYVWRGEGGVRTKRPKQLLVPEMIQGKPKVKKRLIEHDNKQKEKEAGRMLQRNGAHTRRSVWLKGYFPSQGSSCQSSLVAFVVLPFHSDLTLSQGETRDKNTDLSSISHLTPSHILSFSLSSL